jgi:hypothetical protein
VETRQELRETVNVELSDRTHYSKDFGIFLEAPLDHAHLTCSARFNDSLESEEDRKSQKWTTMLNPLRLLPNNSALKSTSVSYFALFRPLHDVQSRFVLSCGIVLAIAAGAPLPIIGVIFARIIDVFPPTEDEVHQRISQLLGVGKYLLPKSCSMGNFESNCIFCGHVGLGFLLGHCWRSYLQRIENSNG